jgi:hypothetical protein
MGLNALKVNTVITAPSVTGAVTTSTTGGTLPAAAYFYKVAALLAYGPGGPSQFGIANTLGYFTTVVGAEGTVTTTGTTSSNTLTVPAVPGATHFAVYRSTVTNTEVFLGIFAATQNGGTTTIVDNGSITPGTTTAASVTSNMLAGNSFVAGGNLGPLYSGAFVLSGTPVQAPPVPTPFTAGRTTCVHNPTGSSITISQSPDGVTAMATWVVVPANSYVDTSYLNGLGGNQGGIPNFLVASAAGAYLVNA